MYIAEYNRSREWKLLRTSIIHLIKRGFILFVIPVCVYLNRVVSSLKRVVTTCLVRTKVYKQVSGALILIH